MKTRLLLRALALPRWSKVAIAILVDALLCVLCVHLAYYLRVNEWADPFGPMLIPSLVSFSLALPIFSAFGMYKAVLRYYGARALTTIVRAVTVYGIIYAAIYSANSFYLVPRTVGILQPILLGLVVIGVRTLISSLLVAETNADKGDTPVANAVIYGAGRSGQQLASALKLSGTVNVIAFVDEDETTWNTTIDGVRTHSPEKLNWLIRRYGITEALLADTETSRTQRSAIVQRLTGAGLSIRTIPGVDQLVRGTVSVEDLKDVEIEDLLRRAPVPPEVDLLRANVTGKVVLVTGAGGSIGSEICRQLAVLAPQALILVETNEYALYAVYEEITARQRQGRAYLTECVPLLANARDEARMREIFEAWGPHTVYHAAAYKHVPLVEHNLLEGVANNVLSARNIAQIAGEVGVENCVLISTDKAVRPTNVMGATKRLSELIFQASSAASQSTTYSMVRFGNVLGSSGSVIPRFREQIAAGGPVTVTHPEITRFFMTIPEAAQLVIQAGGMAQSGDVFVLDMGEPVKIVDMARSMIELSGKKIAPEGTVARGRNEVGIEFVGLRPGEKLYEELLLGDDTIQSSHPRIFRAREPFWQWAELGPQMDRLEQALTERDHKAVRDLMRELVAGFEHDEELVDWVAAKRARDLGDDAGDDIVDDPDGPPPSDQDEAGDGEKRLSA